MVEEGIRYIVTTVDNTYITPIVTINEDQKGITILDMTYLSEPTKTVIEMDSIVKVVQELYRQEDVTSNYLLQKELINA